MHYGLQAIVLALNAMEVSTDNESSIDNESDGTAVYLQQLREHLDAITSPVRRVLEFLLLHFQNFHSYCSPFLRIYLGRSLVCVYAACLH